MLKKKFLQMKFLSKPCDGICSHDSKMIQHFGIANIFFCKYLVKNIFQNIFFQFKKKYLQKIFAIPKCYTILESWEQMPQHGFDKNLIWRNFFFNIQRGDPLDLQKRFLQCGGVILHENKFCKTRSSSNMSKNALLSASGWNPKMHNYHPPLPITIINIKYPPTTLIWKILTLNSTDLHAMYWR